MAGAGRADADERLAESRNERTLGDHGSRHLDGHEFRRRRHDRERERCRLDNQYRRREQQHVADRQLRARSRGSYGCPHSDGHDGLRDERRANLHDQSRFDDVRLYGRPAGLHSPAGVTTLTVTAQGAQGGSAVARWRHGRNRGSDADRVVPGEILDVFVGGQGGTGAGAIGGTGGFNGGAAGGSGGFASIGTAAEAARPTSAAAVVHCQIASLSRGAVAAAPSVRLRRRGRGRNGWRWLQHRRDRRDWWWRWHAVGRWIGWGQPRTSSANGQPGVSGTGGEGGPAPAGLSILPAAAVEVAATSEAEEVPLATSALWAPRAGGGGSSLIAAWGRAYARQSRWQRVGDDFVVGRDAV